MWRVGRRPEGNVGKVCRRRGLKVNTGKKKVIREEGFGCEIRVGGERLEYLPEFRYLGCVWVNKYRCCLVS